MSSVEEIAKQLVDGVRKRCDDLLTLADEWTDLEANIAAADAAELERLRKGEDEAADWLRSEHRHDCRTDGFDRAFASWVDARAARIAFEAKIGGGI